MCETWVCWQSDVWVWFVRHQIKLNQLVEFKYDLLPLILKYVACCVCSTWHILEFSKKRRAYRTLQESVFPSRWSHRLVLSPAPFPTDFPHLSSWITHLLFLVFTNPDIVHENLKMGSDGESDQASGTSSDEVQSPTGVCLRNRGNRRISAEVGFVFPCCRCSLFLHRPLCLFELTVCWGVWVTTY